MPADSFPIFDAHAHAFPDSLAPHALKALTASPRHGPIVPHTDGTVSGLLASMNAAGVHGAILCSIATKPAQVRKITDWSAALIAGEASALPAGAAPRLPRLFPFASIHPDFDEPEAECRRMAALGIRGIKFHPHYMNCPVDDARTHRIARAAAASGLAMTFHAGHDIAFPNCDLATPRALRELHDAVPGLRLQCCHLGGWMRWEELLEYLVGQPIYLETSYSLAHCPRELLLRILTAHLPTHIMWGTDSPWQPHAADLALFRALPISEELKAAALSANTARFLSLH